MVLPIVIPSEFLVPQSDDPSATMVDLTYTDLASNLRNKSYFNDRAILAPTLDVVSQINEYVCKLIPS